MDETDPRLISGGYFDNDDDYTILDWQDEVANGYTLMGYHEWIDSKREGE